jgi:hypothetical protein
LEANGEYCITHQKEKIMKNEKGATLQCILDVSMLAFAVIMFYGCGGDDASGPGGKEIHCTAGCSSTSWGVEGETGQRAEQMTCTRDWIGDNYIETCTGSVTYNATGNTYQFNAVLDWIDCDISVTVTGVGSCTDGP